MADDGLRAKLREGLRAVCHSQSIESAVTGGGIPDLNLCSGGVDVWVECKATDAWIPGDIKPSQIGWSLARMRFGGRVLLATRRRHDGGPRKGPACDELWLHSGVHMAKLKAEGLRAAPWLYRGEGGPSAWDWEQVHASIFKARLT